MKAERDIAARRVEDHEVQMNAVVAQLKEQRQVAEESALENQHLEKLKDEVEARRAELAERLANQEQVVYLDTAKTTAAAAEEVASLREETRRLVGCTRCLRLEG
jgi:fructoselysine-6-P-deglycase FrlB-like protein